MKWKYFSAAERRKIEKLRRNGATPKEIAERLGAGLATIYRELARGDTGTLFENGLPGYSAEIAQQRFTENLHRRGLARKSY